MDSLLASYASSDEEEEQQQHPKGTIPKYGQTSHISSSLTQPQSSSFAFPSLPQPKPSPFPFSLPPPISSSVFSSLPPPTFDNPQTPYPSSSESKPKKVVQFRPPLVLKPPQDESDDDEEEKQKQRKIIKEPTSCNSTSSLSSFFSSLPAPKNTLGSGSTPALGAGRRSIVETNVPTSNADDALENKEIITNEGQESYGGSWVDGSSSISTSEPLTVGSDTSNMIPSHESYGSYGYYEDNGSYGGYEVNYGSYDGVATIASTTLAPENLRVVESVVKMQGKRGRNEIPAEIVEVKQDELMKNRPREDQVKLTGIAFGPSYQPVSTKGKPSKLHKRKHQIGSLYYDMKQKELELAERRSKGFLTKAETHAKYGW